LELETAVSKLAWLSEWVSPPELKAALQNARSLLRPAGPGKENIAHNGTAAPEGGSRPLAEGGVAPPERPGNTASGGGGSGNNSTYSGGRSLSEDFKRMLAEKAAGIDSGAGEDEAAADTGDDDPPLWDGIVRNNAGENSPQVERLLRLIPGTVVK
jgi:hypothetical protein